MMGHLAKEETEVYLWTVVDNNNDGDHQDSQPESDQTETKSIPEKTGSDQSEIGLEEAKCELTSLAKEDGSSIGGPAIWYGISLIMMASHWGPAGMLNESGISTLSLTKRKTLSTSRPG